LLAHRTTATTTPIIIITSTPPPIPTPNKAFKEDWDGAGPARPPGSVATGTASPGGGVTSDGDAQEAPDVVRPGRLLLTLHAMRRELRLRHSDGGSAGADASSSGSGGGGDGGKGSDTVGGSLGVGPLLHRMNQIQIEAVMVLDEMQRGKLKKGGGGGAGGGGAAKAAAGRN